MSKYLVSQKSILANWEIAKQEKIGEFQKIYYSEDVGNAEIENMLKDMNIGLIVAILGKK